MSCSNKSILDTDIYMYAEIGIKAVFAISALVRAILIVKRIETIDKSFSWTNIFAFKLLINFFLSFSYGAYGINLIVDLGKEKKQEQEQENPPCLPKLIYYIFSWFIWLLSALVLFLEFNRKLSQSWVCLRGFWLVNGIILYSKFYFFLFDFKNLDGYNFEFHLLFFNSILSCFLFWFSVFLHFDYRLNENKKCAQLVKNDVEDTGKTKSLNETEDESKCVVKTGESKFFLELNIKEGNIELDETLVPSLPEEDKEKISDYINEQILIFNLKIKIAKKTHRKYKTKKKIREVITFNENMSQIFRSRSSKGSGNSSLVKSVIQQAYTTSLSILNSANYAVIPQNPTKTSKLVDQNKICEKITILEAIYRKLCSISVEFTFEFLNFLEATENNLFEVLKSKSSINSPFSPEEKEQILDYVIVLDPNQDAN